MVRHTDAIFFDDSLRELRRSVRRFVSDRLAPHASTWEADEAFPRSLYAESAQAGVLGVGFPEALGGSGGDVRHMLVVAEELTRSGSPGLAASLGSLVIALPPIVHAGTEDQHDRFVRPVLTGAKIAALAVTEPSGGSDVANLRTVARRVDGGYVVNGTKTFITSGTRADVFTVAVRTGGDGAGGVSILVVERGTAGFETGPNLAKLGWHASDTAELHFEDCFVPTSNRIGEENAGFVVLMRNFANERLILAATATEIARMAFESALDWSEERTAFGRPLTGFQVTRHRLADLATQIEQTAAFVWSIAVRVARDEPCLREVAMAKNAATDMASQVVDACLQLHGGHGYMRGTLIERLYRDVRLYPIGGGTREIMNELIARQLRG